MQHLFVTFAFAIVLSFTSIYSTRTHPEIVQNRLPDDDEKADQLRRMIENENAASRMADAHKAAFPPWKRSWRLSSENYVVRIPGSV